MSGRETRPGEPARVALHQAVALRFKQLDEYTEELSANVSTGGMFIRTDRPAPVGAVLEFELRPGGSQPPIAGKAQVAWVRRRSRLEERPVGMGVRFVELEDDSRRAIAELVAANGDGEADEAAALGAEADEEPGATEPPEPDDDRPVEVAAPEAATAEPPAAAAAIPAPRGAFAAAEAGRSRRAAWLLLGLTLIAALVVWLWPRPGPDPPIAASEPAATAPVAATSETAERPAGGEPAPADARPEPLLLVDRWARAWSEQRVEAYLGAYSPGFTPPQGLDRSTWERVRRARILAPRWIRVELAFVELEELTANLCRVRFVQAYESDGYSDVVRKVLMLERREEGWRILEEIVEP